VTYLFLLALAFTDETEVDGLFDFADEVVFGDQFFQRDKGKLGSALKAGFAEQGGSLLDMYYRYYIILTR